MNITVPTYSKAWKPYTSLLVVKHGNMLWFHQLEAKANNGIKNHLLKLEPISIDILISSKVSTPSSYALLTRFMDQKILRPTISLNMVYSPTLLIVFPNHSKIMLYIGQIFIFYPPKINVVWFLQLKNAFFSSTKCCERTS
jgi:hypothetical protein